MRLSAIIFSVLCCTAATLYASDSDAQTALDKKVSVQLRNASIQEALDKIGGLANVSFTYAGNQTLATNKVSIDVKNRKLSDVLDMMLNPYPLSYVVVEDRIVVRQDASKKPRSEAVEAVVRKEVLEAAAAPPFVLKGVVSGKAGILAGASVTIKGKNRGTVTNEKGEFELHDVNTGDVIEIVMTGYKTQSITVNENKKRLDIVLIEEASELQDVVVTGFNNVSKKKFTGSSVTLKIDDVKMDGVIDVSRMLEGRAAGVSVQNVSGTFGSAPKLRIRGATSINGENKPLWVVDGVVLEDLVNISNDQLSSGDPTTLLGSSVAGINSNDIESFNILKDAAATALYGARAMNGVIVITTKKGAKGKTNVNYTGNFSTQLKPTYGSYNIMNSAEQMSVWAELERKGKLGTSLLSGSNYGVYGKMYELMDADEYGNVQLENTTAAKKAFLLRYAKVNTDWFNILFRNSFVQEHSLSVASGSDKTQSFFSTSFYNDNGWTIADNVKRYTLNFRNNYTLSDKFSFGFLTTASYRQQRAPGTLSRQGNAVTGTFERDFDLNPFSYSLNTSRALTAYDENGNKEYFRRNYAPFNIFTESENNRLKINVIDLKLQGDAQYKFSKSLKYDFVGNVRYVRSTREHEITEYANMANAYRANGTSTIAENNKFLYRNPDEPESLPQVVLPYGGFYNRSENQLLSFDLRNSISYTKTFNNVHAFTALAGQQVRLAERQNFSNTGYGYQYDNGGVPFTDPMILKQTIESNFPYYDMTKTFDRFVGFYANVDYMFDRRYSVSIVGRYDGSNQLGSSRTARWLPTGTVSAAWNVDEENFIKDIKAITYLKVRGSYGLTASLGPATNSNVVLRNQQANRPYSLERESVIRLINLENSELTWEKNHQLNFGIDFGLFENRITATVEPWFRKSFDLIGSFKTSGIGGEPRKLANYADMKSNGLDVVVTGEILRKKDWKWSSTITMGYNKTRITHIRNQPLIFDLVKAEGGNLEGYPVNSLFSIDYLRMVRTQGTPIFKDESGKDNAAVYLQAEGTDSILVYNGSVDPKFTGGFNNTFSYKQFSLNIFFTFQAGNKIRLYPSFQNGYTDYNALPKEFYDRYEVIGDQLTPGVVPSIIDRVTAAQLAGTYAYNNYNYSTERIAKGDFLRLKTVSLTYNLSPELIQRWKAFRALSFTLAAINPWLIYADKNLEGQDPEFFNTGGVAQPIQKQITLSVKAGF
ncbi:SusC/RagA family TonB-linked outer membrane protein [Filimonas effusa]|uniref:SusC/RagA family TonB-linked outer membrane protein n=1 Tax=Filimonas effusa TaxID=2508721 RepID=A0A4Q1DAQ9_9BACT|nr:SusC/RagA family TonB-linked outer membrane protein [Filimonas effusa]RXK86502.1 SusC/RagA family TonB-linked outer membrane protein [Filimonas effusa]